MKFWEKNCFVLQRWRHYPLWRYLLKGTVKRDYYFRSMTSYQYCQYILRRNSEKLLETFATISSSMSLVDFFSSVQFEDLISIFGGFLEVFFQCYNATLTLVSLKRVIEWMFRITEWGSPFILLQQGSKKCWNSSVRRQKYWLRKIYLNK
jgi:hypothetical protein